MEISRRKNTLHRRGVGVLVIAVIRPKALLVQFFVKPTSKPAYGIPFSSVKN